MSSDRPEPTTDSTILAEPPEPAARLVFGDRLDLARKYAELLAGTGVERGLVGPREPGRVWDRHLLNCAVLGELIAPGGTVLDVGSGAGLPGLALAVARPDLPVVLLEPLARRYTYLVDVVRALGLTDQVEVVRGRAEEYRGPLVEVVTSRAVAPLDRLAGWCLPLAKAAGRMLALKGSSAADEIGIHRDTVRRLGGGEPAIRQCGGGTLALPTTVVEVIRERVLDQSRKGARTGGGRGRPGTGRR